MSGRPGGLLAWQWSLYPEGHRNRANLLVHAVTNPLFLSGNIALVASPFIGVWFAPGGLVAMALAMALQGRTHKLEQTPPVPFAGPLEVLGRIFAEQWIQFPRYVLSGGFFRALRGA
jgi:hypothetical protein